jgi:hypothetical protein
LASFLWRARSAMRIDRVPLFAGHGLADANYRPPRLPYASVIGPLNLELEPDRDPPRAVFLSVQTPGYLAGASRQPTDLVPPPGTLTVRLDGEAEAPIALDFGGLAGDPLSDADTGRAVADAIETAIRTAVDDGEFTADGPPIDEQARLDELRATTVRWDRARSRLVMASGRRGVFAGSDLAARQPSRVEVRDGRLPAALGLGEGALSAAGRIVRHRRPNPTAVAVDVRFDIWSGSQLELANAIDAWARITPTRGQLLERHALLAADAEHGATTIRLQPDGESPTRWTLLQLERGGGRFADRLTGRAVDLENGATVDDEGVSFDAGAVARLRFLEPQPIPYAWIPDHPGLEGYAASLRLQLDAGGAAGDALRVLALEHDGRVVLALAVELAEENGNLRARLLGMADRADPPGGQFAEAVATVDLEELERGAEVHVTADARTGAVSLFLNGEPLEASPAAPQPGRPAGGPDMDLVLGDQTGTPIPFTVSHLQLHGHPIGPLDPKLRPSAAPASAWSPGDLISLARSEDGISPAGDSFLATVVGVDGDELTLDRAIQGTFRRGSTLVYSRSLFFSQRQLRRQDDLMNQLYRICAEYRVSTFLDERYPSVSAPLVEIPEVELRDLARLTAEVADPDHPEYPARPASGHPGIRVQLTSNVADRRS